MKSTTMKIVQDCIASNRRRTSNLSMQLATASECGPNLKGFEIHKALEQARQILDTLEQTSRIIENSN